MPQIPVSPGTYTIVDDVDFGWASRCHWTVRKTANNWYARRSDRDHRGARIIRQLHRDIAEKVFHRELGTDECIDHINGNGLDNRRCNLRLCTREENVRNQRKARRPTSSRYKGVTWHKGEKRWQASIRVAGQRYYLGKYDNEDDAARAYDDAARRFHGEFAAANLPKAT